MKKRIPLEKILESVCSKLDKKINEYSDILPESKVDIFLLGGYSMDVYNEEYNLDLKEFRSTDDVDFYSNEAKILGDNITPMGARIDLSEDLNNELNEFRMDIFDWISGVDHPYFKERFEKTSENATKIKETDNLVMYVIEPDVFVGNKLLSKRQDSTRDKDLKDVKRLYNAFKEKGYHDIIEKIDDMVDKCELHNEFEMAINNYSNLNS